MASFIEVTQLMYEPREKQSVLINLDAIDVIRRRGDGSTLWLRGEQPTSIEAVESYEYLVSILTAWQPRYEKSPVVQLGEPMPSRPPTNSNGGPGQ